MILKKRRREAATYIQLRVLLHGGVGYSIVGCPVLLDGQQGCVCRVLHGESATGATAPQGVNLDHHGLPRTKKNNAIQVTTL